MLFRFIRADGIRLINLPAKASEHQAGRHGGVAFQRGVSNFITNRIQPQEKDSV
jgi:hypothetical protein